METVTNIQLIDASRPTSVEAQSDTGTGNNSQWTNTASHGLKLNPGDQVSVSNVFINTAGAGSSTLETTGKIIDTVSFKHTKQTFSQPESLNPFGFLQHPIMGDGVLPSDFQYEIGPYGCEWVDTGEVTTTKQIKDNEFNVVVSYYKNTNGENYIHLPRKYTSRVDPLSESIPYDEYGTANGEGPQGYGKRDKARQKLWYQCDDKVNGRPEKSPTYRCYNDWHWYKGLKSYAPYAPVPKSGVLWEDVKMPSYGNIKKDGSDGNSQFYDTNMWKQKNDNSRYTIYTAQRTMYNDRDIENFRWDFGGGDSGGRFFGFQPSYQMFHKYRELKEYKVTKGYNDPHNVAYQLTSQFGDPKLGPMPIITQQKNFDPTVSTLTDGQTVPPFPCHITSNSNGETFKPFACANYNTLNQDDWVTWNGFPGGGGVSDDGQVVPNLQWCFAGFDPDAGYVEPTLAQKKKLMNMYTSYNMIGVKRPELWDAGRDLTLWKLDKLKKAAFPIDTGPVNNYYTSGYRSQEGGPQPQDWRLGDGWGAGTINTHDWIRTRLEWDPELLLKLKALFEAQLFYPELLDFANRDTGTNGVRPTADKSGNSFKDLLKMDTPAVQANLRVKSVANPNGVSSVFDKRFIHMGGPGLSLRGDGTDKNYHLGNELTDYNSLTNQDRQSCPLWFYFDSNMKDTYSENPTAMYLSSGVQTSQDLCYGFAYKDIDPADGRAYITLNIRGLPTAADEGAGVKLYGNDGALSDRAIGWDWHFNAYGTSAIMLYSGWVPQDADAEHSAGMGTQGNDVVGVLGDITFNGGPSLGPGRNGTNFTTGGYAISKLLRQVYLGAIDPLIQFTDANSRFTIQNLHTPEQIQNAANTGKATDLKDGSTILPKADAGTNVYKINKKLTLWNNFTPEMCPYRNPESFKAPYYKDGEYVSVADESGGTKYRYTTLIGQAAGEWIDSDAGGDTKGYVAKTTGGAANTGQNQGWATDTGVASGHGNAEGTFQSSAVAFKDKWGVQSVTGNSREISQQQEYDAQNQNLEEFIVYDGHCGIFLEDFGITDEKKWNKSLFGIMGWSFSQFNPSIKINRQTKITRVNYKDISPLTTNADIPQKDLPTQIKNGWQQAMYTLQVPCPLLTNLWYGHVLGFEQANAVLPEYPPSERDFNAGPTQPMGDKRWCYINSELNQPQIYPQIVNPQTSMSIICENLPIKMKSPYYLIKSSIISSQANYIKDKTPLPIVAVANKENLFGDFAFASGSDITFTVQETSYLTEIVTQVFDSDMSPAILDENSSVIYKIVKSIQKDPNLVATLLKGNGEPRKNVEDWNNFTE